MFEKETGVKELMKMMMMMMTMMMMMMMMIVLVFGENSDYGSGDDHSGDVNTCRWAQGSRLPGTPVWIRLKMNHHHHHHQLHHPSFHHHHRCVVCLPNLLTGIC